MVRVCLTQSQNSAECICSRITSSGSKTGVFEEGRLHVHAAKIACNPIGTRALAHDARSDHPIQNVAGFGFIIRALLHIWE
jgi:hypothetical protein